MIEGANVEQKLISPDEPKEGQEVFAPSEGPFEAPAKESVPGPMYKSVDEVLPELAPLSETGDDGTSELPVDRRDFMRLFSASALLASAAGCVRRPEEKAVPYLDQPVDQIVGEPTYYNTTCAECPSACGLQVKTREGRPVKIEGNPRNLISQGATCALGQGTLQGLYHPERSETPKVRVGNTVEDAHWDDVFPLIGEAVSNGKNVGIFTNGSTGNRDDFLRLFLDRIGSKNRYLYTYEPNGLFSTISAAHKIAFGVDSIPRLRLADRDQYGRAVFTADLLVGIGTDFLEVGVSPVYSNKSFSEFHGFRQGRKGKFVQFESNMTQTGAAADERHPIGPGHEVATALLLVRSLLAHSKAKGSSAERSEIRRVLRAQEAFLNQAESQVGIAKQVFDDLAEQLITKKGAVVCGASGNVDENATALQLAAIMSNVLAGSYGEVLLLDRAWMKAPVQAGDLERFRKDAADLDVLFIVNSNPAFTLPPSWGFHDLVKKIETVVSIQPMPNETDELAKFVLPGHHHLESWGDEQPVAGYWTARQPVVRPTRNSRQAEDILLWVAAAAGKSLKYREYREFLMQRWRRVYDLLGLRGKIKYERFTKGLLRQGFAGKEGRRRVRGMSGVAAKFKLKEVASGMRLLAPIGARLQDGRGADKPVLQEAGDSMTTIAWDSWVAMSPSKAKELGFRRNDVLLVEGPGGSFEAALYPLPGVHADTVVVPRGNGRRHGSRVFSGIGVDPLVAFSQSSDDLSGQPAVANAAVKVSRTGKMFHLAAMQKHNDIDNRTDVLKVMTLATAREKMGKTIDVDGAPDLYPNLEETEYRWGMSIDLDKCTGCSACMVACSQENNVPQVGRQQILMGREMHWIRLDRYFAGNVDNPEVSYQPVMCQHCRHAPCEAVCPVYATVHDANGLNAQVYNRCVGTRYCANACPYKVRRFNWFTHRWNVIAKNEYSRNPRALNPDVTVRTRGIMEKCTMCVQRLRDAKHRAKQWRGDDATVQDGEVATACQQVCPADAIKVGNIKDKRSAVANQRKDSRSFLMLNGDPEHKHWGIKTWPNVNYLAKVSHAESAFSKSHDEDHGSGHDDEHHG